jgi:hypothetical protein
MTLEDWKQLLELLQRKWQAKSQDMSTVQSGDTISLSLTDESILKQLLYQALGEKSILTALTEQAKTLFFKAIEKDHNDLLTRGEEEAHALIFNEICVAINHVLEEGIIFDVFQNAFTLLLICLERPDFFLYQPDSTECIVDPDEHGLHPEYGKVTCLHIVYHNLYGFLQNALGLAFVQWHQEHRCDE